ncbi:DJ-1/PfpI family protein, partial [Emergencia timonensis]
MVYVFLANGFEEIEALTVVDLLRRADIQVKTVSVMEDRLVYGSKGIGVEADILFKA